MSAINLSTLFNQKVFRIPDYQRGYAWREKQYNEMWEDLEDISEVQDELRKHYLGTIYLEETVRSENEKWLTGTKFYNIVDGQQRLTTISILLHQLICVAENGYCEEPTDDLIKKFICQCNLSGNSKIYKFSYVESDKNYNYLLHSVFDDPKVILLNHFHNHYTKNLSEAKSYFKEKVSKLSPAERELLFKKITTSLLFDVRIIEKDLDVQAVFETMNNRGKPLSTLEKLKNRLIYLTVRLNSSQEDKDNLRKKINDSWGKIYSSLAENPDQVLDEDEFLSAHLSLYRVPKEYTFSEKAAEEKVFQMFCSRPDKFEMEDGKREPFISFQKIEDYIIKLSELAPIWQEIHFSSSLVIRKILTLNKSKEVRIFLGSISIANAIRTQKEELFDNILKIMFRNRVPGIGVLDERSTANWARDLYRQEDDVPSILQKTIGLINSDINIKNIITQFRNLFTYERGPKGFHRWGALKFFLFEYDEYLRQQAEEHNLKISLDDFEETTIEHVIPQQFAEYWQAEVSLFSDFFSSEVNGEMAQKVIIHTLGNLTILKDGKNSALGNKGWLEKRERFRTGSYNEIEISGNECWSFDKIAIRGRKMLRFLENQVTGLSFSNEEIDEILFSEQYIIKRINGN